MEENVYLQYQSMKQKSTLEGENSLIDLNENYSMYSVGTLRTL